MECCVISSFDPLYNNYDVWFQEFSQKYTNLIFVKVDVDENDVSRLHNVSFHLITLLQRQSFHMSECITTQVVIPYGNITRGHFI